MSGLWSGANPRRFATAAKGADHLEAVERVKEWTRRRFSLSDSDVVLVTEGPSVLPGFPPLETVIAFWSGDGARHHFRVFKSAGDIAEDDVPPAWMKEALAAADGIECYCC
jgi:nitrate reductase delta subunit